MEIQKEIHPEEKIRQKLAGYLNKMIGKEGYGKLSCKIFVHVLTSMGCELFRKVQHSERMEDPMDTLPI